MPRARAVRGWPVLTMVRGQVMMADGEIVGHPGHGWYQPRFAREEAAAEKESR